MSACQFMNLAISSAEGDVTKYTLAKITMDNHGKPISTVYIPKVLQHSKRNDLSTGIKVWNIAEHSLKTKAFYKTRKIFIIQFFNKKFVIGGIYSYLLSYAILFYKLLSIFRTFSVLGFIRFWSLYNQRKSQGYSITLALLFPSLKQYIERSLHFISDIGGDF